MTKSESIDQLAVALAKFQGSMGAISRDSDNPFFKSRYASLSAVIEDTRDPLAENGLSYVQFPEGINGLTTVLMHTSGQWMMATYEMNPVDSKPQSVGSALTYMRRYSLCSMLGLRTEDDDGNEASKPKVKPNGQGAVIHVPVARIKDDAKIIVSGTDTDEPAKPVPVTVEAQRSRIRSLLIGRGVDTASIAKCEKYVKDTTEMDLTPANFVAIIRYLETNAGN